MGSLVLYGLGGGMGAWTSFALIESASAPNFIYTFGSQGPASRVFSPTEQAGLYLLGITLGMAAAWIVSFLFGLATRRDLGKPRWLGGPVLSVSAALYAAFVVALTLEESLAFFDAWTPAISSLAFAFTVILCRAVGCMFKST